MSNIWPDPKPIRKKGHDKSPVFPVALAARNAVKATETKNEELL
jgi:hypothetical protein